MNARTRLFQGQIFFLLALLALGCVKAKVEQPTYELGEVGTLIISNPSPLPMAVGGCNPSSYQERLPGRWVPDPLIRTACAFTTELSGRHELTDYQIIPPGGSIEVAFPTEWVRATPAIIRVLHRVSTACERVETPGEPLRCHRVEQITTDPIVIFEPGTSETVGAS